MTAIQTQLLQHLVLHSPKTLGNRPTKIRYDTRDNYFYVIVEFETAENIVFKVWAEEVPPTLKNGGKSDTKILPKGVATHLEGK